MKKSYGGTPTKFQPEEIPEYDKDTDTLRLCAPVSPSQNLLNSWISNRNFRLIKKFRKETLDHLKLQAIVALGAGYPRPWAQFVELTIIRCSETKRRLDRGNIIGGAKTTIDCLQIRFGGGKHWFIGAGLIVEDSDDHLKIVKAENRPMGKHVDLDVGTWLFLKRIR